MFVGVTLSLTILALGAYRGISAMALSTRDPGLQWADATTVKDITRQITFAEASAGDSAWRAEHARFYSLAELRVRGDGRRSPREAMQDRVFAFSKKGQRAQAIAELERWVASNRHDTDALVWLARLLKEAGRTAESVQRYRQALAN
jgi:Flp pilus assembly protein TadD